MTELKALIRNVPDFPKQGIVFKDITPLLQSPSGLALAVELLANPFRGQGIEAVVGAESRGFIFGTALAQALSAGFVPVRKPGKLPSKKLSLTYDLEYGQDTLEIHRDAIRPGQKCLMVDDLLATGGTVEAAVKLIRRAGGTVTDAAFVISLPALGGEARLTAAGVKVLSLVEFDGE